MGSSVAFMLCESISIPSKNGRDSMAATGGVEVNEAFLFRLVTFHQTKLSYPAGGGNRF
jgi:hypothetical protein